MTIRMQLLGVMGMLGLLLLGLAGMSAGDAWRQRSAASMVSESSTHADLLLESARYLIEERDATRLALSSDAAARRQLLAQARTNRDKARTSLESAIGLISGHGTHASAAVGRILEQVRAGGAEIDRLRGRVDAAAASGGNDRALVKEWWQSATGLVQSVEELRLATSRAANDVDAVSGTYSMLKHSVLVMDDYAGRERVVIGEHIARGLPLSPRQVQQLFGYRGRVENAWEGLRETGASDGMVESVVRAVEASERSFIEDFGKVREGVYNAGVLARAYPVDVPTWQAASSDAIASLGALQDALIEANRLHIKETSSTAWRNLLLVGFLLGLGLAACLAAFFVVMNRVARPLDNMTDAMGRLAAGEMDVQIPAAGRSDEIGRMADAVQVFKGNAIERERMAAEREQEQAANTRRAERVLEICGGFDKTATGALGSVAEASTEMQATAQQMTSTAEETRRQSATVATASDQATANVQMVASTAEELSASISEIGRQVMQSAKIAANAVTEAEATNDTVQGLAEAASKIGDVVDLINDIAGQTNLWRLTRPSRPRAPARPARASRWSPRRSRTWPTRRPRRPRISRSRSAVQEETTGAVDAIQKIRGIISEISDISTTISSAVEEQGVSTQEIARNVQQAAKGTQDVNATIESVSKAAGETGSAAGQVLGASQEMSRQAEGLRGEVERFLAEIRAA